MPTKKQISPKTHIHKVLVVHMSFHTPSHRETMRLVKNTLEKKGIEYYFLHRSRLNKMVTRNKDLIIAIGGDGTFIRTSHFVFDDTPIYGINSDPSLKEGFFLRSTKKTFVENFEKIIDGKAKLTKFSRVKASINGKKVPELAINEFFYGHVKAHCMSAYKITVAEKKPRKGIVTKSERHKSSGVIVSAGAGSKAWLLSAGGTKMPMNSSRVQYLAREVYHGTLTKRNILNGFLKSGEYLEIESEINQGVLVADSVSKPYPVKIGSKVRLEPSETMLNAYWI